MKKIYLFILALTTLITTNIVKAEDTKTEDLLYIESVELVSKSETAIEKTPPTFKGLNINVDVKLVNLLDFIEYKIIVKNKSDKELELELETIDSPSDHIKYTFNYNEGEKISQNESTYVILKIDYENSALEKMLENSSSYNEQKNFYFNFLYDGKYLTSEVLGEKTEVEQPEEPSIPPIEEPKEEIENPETGNSVILTISILLVGAIIILISLKLNKPKFMLLLLPMIISIPLCINAQEKVNVIKLKITTNIEIEFKTAKLLSGKKFNFQLKSLSNNLEYPIWDTEDDTNIRWEMDDEKISYFKRTTSQPSETIHTKIISASDSPYEIKAWYDTNTSTIYWYSEAYKVYFNENCNEMFHKFNNAISFEIKEIDASKITTARLMFYYFGYNSPQFYLDISDWDVRNIKDTSSMFAHFGRNSNRAFLKMDNWNLESLNINPAYMFDYAGGNASKIEISMQNAKIGTDKDVNSMFGNLGEYADELYLNIDNMEFTNSNYISYLFIYAGRQAGVFQLKMNNFNAPKATSLSSLFNKLGYETKNVLDLYINNLSAEAATDISSMFYNSCRQVNTLRLEAKDWNVSSANNLNSMFQIFGTNIKNSFTLDLTTWKFGDITSAVSMFSGALNGTSSTKIKVIFNNMKFNNVKDFGYMFDELGSKAQELEIDISNWEFTNSSRIGEILNDIASEANRLNLNMSNWKINNVERITGLLSYAGRKAQVVNANLSNWEIKNVKDMSSLFASSWDNSSIVTLNIDNWQVDAATGNLSSMFNNTGAKSISELDLSGWNFSDIASTDYMFQGMNKLKTIFVSDSWNLETIESSTNMFQNCSSLTGANGTTYDSSKIDKEYARIDTPETPGYFTLKIN